MFSSKFLSGANPLNAVSSAVNKFGLFGDDGEGDKKSASQPTGKPPGDQKPAVGPGKDAKQQQPATKSSQGSPMQKSQPVSQQGSPQPQGNGQTRPLAKSAGPQATSKTGAPPGAQHKGEPPTGQPKGPPQQSSPKPVPQQLASTKSASPAGSPKAISQHVTTKTTMQQQGPSKTSAQQQEPAKTEVQGSIKPGTKTGQQPQTSLQTGEKQKEAQRGVGISSQPQSSNKQEPGQQGIKPGLVTAGKTPASPGATKARPQSKCLCPVCKTTEINVHSKEPPNYKTCTQCKAEVCSLCGFSPPDSEGREWLCLNCQIQRAQAAPKTTGPPMKGPPANKTSTPKGQIISPAKPIKTEMAATGSPQKTPPTLTKVPDKGSITKSDNQKQGSPAPAHKNMAESHTTSGSQKPNQTSQTGQKQSSATAAPQQESGGLFGFGGKTEAAKAEESVTGKMFGFGSSIFSSASSLMASAVQEEPKTTPPVSPKMQSNKDTKASTKPSQSETDKKKLEAQQDKVLQTGKDTKEPPPSTNPSTCPLCKTSLNKGSKNPPNYSTCTECKSTVCNQCGFNPMPNVKEGKEWLCLNCQVKRATGGMEPQKDTPLSGSDKKMTPAQAATQKSPTPASPQRKESKAAPQASKPEGPDSKDRMNANPGPKIPQGNVKTAPEKQPEQPGKKQDPGGIFGFGGAKSQPSAASPAESVTGKMFGFGSSIFSSASTMISSAVQDEHKVTPPISPKMSPAKDSKSSTIKTQEKKLDPSQQAKGLTSVQPKNNQVSPEPPRKGSSSPVVSKAGHSTCPLCKVQLNTGSKDPPNYNTCTKCKSIVCNQCGFNPMPNVKEVKEWVCLNCQMQNALAASGPPSGPPTITQQASPNKSNDSAVHIKKDTPPLDKPQKKVTQTPTESTTSEASSSVSPQRKPQASPEPPAKMGVSKPPGSQQASPSVQKIPQPGPATGPQKITNQPGPKKSTSTSSTQESSGFFGFGGPKPQPDSAKPTESLGGKMFGFGSSIFNSASSLVSTAVQDESKKTPPVSPKLPVKKTDQEKRVEETQQPKPSPISQAKIQHKEAEIKKDAPASSTAPTVQSNCPLCKTELNMDSKKPPNYKKCTECKTTVCDRCGFNPMPNMSEGKEWLCLNCQMQRALKSSEQAGPPITPQSASKTSPTAVQKKSSPNEVKASKEMNAPSKMETSASDTTKQTDSLVKSVPHIQDSLPATPVAKAAEIKKQASPIVERKTVGDQKQMNVAMQQKQSKAPINPQEQGKPPASSGPKPAPEASKTTESIGGKMFGFGSSIFSSASTLISSAVQEESRTSPASSRKMSAPAQISPKMSVSPKISPKGTPSVSPKMSPVREPKGVSQKPEQKMNSDEAFKSKEEKSLQPASKEASVAKPAPKVGQKTCPLCKIELNIGSTHSPNYNTCTLCKITVCNQCGFSPMPMGEVTEWLCLDCQMKRAVGSSEPPAPPALKSQLSPKIVPTPGADAKLTSPQKSPETAAEKREKSEQIGDQGKKSKPQVQAEKREVNMPLQKGSHKPDKEKIAAEPGRATPATQQESGSFFGFGGVKVQAEADKTTEKVTGKMFGFGSSIFNSASTLITSAVQDQPKTTPPVSPKMSPAKDSKSLPVKKQEQEKKTEEKQVKTLPSAQPKLDETKAIASKQPDQQKKAAASQQSNTPPSVQSTLDKVQAEPPNPTAAKKPVLKPDQAQCPLCKIKLNIGSKDPPNYNTCTGCKNTVCNQCGFNPRPNETELKQWLCLTCQMEHALGEPQSSEVSSIKTQSLAKPQKRESSQAEPEKKQPSPLPSPARKLSATPQQVTSEATNKPVAKEQPSPVHLPEVQKTPPASKSPEPVKRTERKQSNAAPVTQKESGGLFGFGVGKTQPEEKPAESVTGKMFGFGSSIFSSASTLITSAVQEQPKTTPPVSPKISPATEVKAAAAQAKIKPEQPQQTKRPQVLQTKVDKTSEPQRTVETAQDVVKPSQVACPLCKVELNRGSKDPPNYNICTECKNTVCNQCGFNPMPNEQKIKEWLCLTCQTQRALKATETSAPQMMKPPPSPGKVPAPASADKESTPSQMKDNKKQVLSTTPSEQQRKVETVKDSTTVPPLGKDSDDVQTLKKEREESPPSVIGIPSSTSLLNKEKGSDKKTHPQASAETGVLEPTDKVPESKEKAAEKEQRVNQLFDQEQSRTVLDKKSKPDAKVPVQISSSSVQPSNQESEGFFGFGSPKTKRAASISTETVTGKMFGFGSSLISSASSLITSAGQEETVPSPRKMSAPVVAGKISPKPSPPISPRKDLSKELIPDAGQNPPQEPQTRSNKAPSTGESKADRGLSQLQKTEADAFKGKVSTCPLCKTELNLLSKNPPNYNTCTECKTIVCTKCGFSPMPTVTQEKEWLCLTCQMQRALGASEPPGLPMIKPHLSPRKEAPDTPAKSETPISTNQGDIFKPSESKKEPVEVDATKESAQTATGAPTERAAPTDTRINVPPSSPSPVVDTVKVKQEVKALEKPAAPPEKVKETSKEEAKVPTPAQPDTNKEKAIPKEAPKVQTPAQPDTNKEKPISKEAPKVQAPIKSGAILDKGIPKEAAKVQAPTLPDMDNKDVILKSQKPAPPDPEKSKPAPKQPLKAGTSPAEAATPPVQTAKQESGGFFSFGTPKTPPTAAKSAESVKGKMFGFGSSFLSSASTLISTAVQDEPKTTPPTAQTKLNASSVSPKTTPPVSPKMTQQKDIKPSLAPKPESPKQVKTAPSTQVKEPQQPSHTLLPAKDTEAATQRPKEKEPRIGETTSKTDKPPSKLPQKSTDIPDSGKAVESNCPLCKVKLNKGSNDPPNFNTCTQCKSTVCNQCGFNPMPNVSEVKEWLCLNCQVQRALGAADVIQPDVVNAQQLQSKTPTNVVSTQEKPKEQMDKQTKETAYVEKKVSTSVQKIETTQQDSVQNKSISAGSEQTKAQDVTGKEQPVQKPTQVQKAEAAKGETKQGPAEEEASKQPQQPTKPDPVKSPSAAQPKKQESGGFFGFGGPKTAPTAATKPTESVTGKMFGFGSSFLSSASTLITSTVQDEPKTTPPTPRKLSTPSSVSPKTSPPVSPKISTAKETKPPIAQKPPQQDKPPIQAKSQKLTSELQKPTEVPQTKDLSTCPLCKVTLNKGSKDPPNYNTCTGCKSTVCNLCGFNPMPHTGVKEWLCLNCQTQRALSGQFEDSIKPQHTPAATSPKNVEPQIATTKAEPTPKLQPVAAMVEAVQKIPTAQAEVESAAVKMQAMATTSNTQEVSKKEPSVPIPGAIQQEDEKRRDKIEVDEQKIPKAPDSAEDVNKAKIKSLPPANVSLPETKVQTTTSTTQKQPVEKLTDAKMSVQQDEVQNQTTDLNQQVMEETGQVMDADSGEKSVEKKTVQESQPVSRVDLILQDEHEPQDQPQILPIPLEVIEEQSVESGKVHTDVDVPIAPKEVIKTERRRLSVQAMDESSDSELTPSPKDQRKRLQVTNLSSSSEGLKTESGDSSVEDEEFIRKQIMGMGDEEMSDHEKWEENLQYVKDAELDNAKLSAKSATEDVLDNEDIPVKDVIPSTADTVTAQTAPETMPRAIFKKAVPVMRQRQSTDEDIDSITESLSKGSSSVQVSSFTPESAHTSASSLEEDSDSSPSRSKSRPDKQTRKGKHRQSTHPLPTIEDSSDEEKMKARGQQVSPLNASSTEDLRQVTITDETNKTSGSEYSASIESDTEFKKAVQRGRKPSPTVIPYTPEPVVERTTITKPLKTAEETYEEIIQKTKSIPGDSPPDIEPLYGGMSIEDYLYESLVEDPEIKMCETQEKEPETDLESKSPKKLRSPEEVYEEMMQKKKELLLIEHEFQQAQTAMGSAVSGVSVADTEQVLETCVVTIPPEETSLNVQTTVQPLTDENSMELSLKKKKRPAPPRPSEPPKRSEVTGIPFTTRGSISFVRPMLPQDPALTKALFPIPDLKITQCSSGEDEEDSLADEYGIGISSDITPSDDSEPKDDLSTSPPLSDIVEMEPICVICEVPEPKPIPTPISAPELTATSSPVSTVSPPTSPATPDSSLCSNATTSSSFQVQTPPSSDTTPLSTPTPPTSCRGQSPPEISPPDSSEARVALSTVVVTIPDVVSPLSNAQTTVAQIKSFTTQAQNIAQVMPSSALPVIIQMPDLVSTPSQTSTSVPSVLQVSAPSTAPAVVSKQSTVTTPTVAVISTSHASNRQTPDPGPVIVQMPDVVSTTNSTSEETPPPLTGLRTTTYQAPTKLVQSVPVQPSIPSGSPTSQAPLQMAAGLPTGSSTTIVKKKVPPPPPPRSTSVSLPESTMDQPVTKTEIVPSSTTSIAGSQQMQSVVVDIQPRIEKAQQDGKCVPQVVTQTRQGHIVIIVPSAEHISQHGQATQVETTTSPTISSSHDVKTKDSDSDIQRAVISPSTLSSIKVSVPPLPPKPSGATKSVVPEEATISKPTTLPKPSGSIITTVTTDSVSASSQISKPPPPIPPKPTSIPAGLVFSHKPGESVKPPPPPVAPKAATLPRTKEPPSALSLSLTRPVDTKGTTSPKSPLSPRHGKCLQTYVVITLPSELGSPTEAITVQAPLRRGSIPSTKVSGIQTTHLEQRTHTDVLSGQAAVRRASVPTVKQLPPVPVVPVVSDEAFQGAIQTSQSVAEGATLLAQQDTLIKVQSQPPPIKKPYVEQEPSFTPPLAASKPTCEIITIPPVTEPAIVPATASVQSILYDEQEHLPQKDFGMVSADHPEIPNSAVPVITDSLIENIAWQSDSQVSLDALEISPRSVIDSAFSTQKEIEQTDEDLLSVVIVTKAVPIGSQASQVSGEVVKQREEEIKVTPGLKEYEKSPDFNKTPILSYVSPAAENIQQVFTSDQNLLTEVITEYSITASPTEVVTSDFDLKQDVSTRSPETQPVVAAPPAVKSAEMILETVPPKREISSVPEVTPSFFLQTEIVEKYPEITPDSFLPQTCTSSVTLHKSVHEETQAIPQGYQPIRSTASNDANERDGSISSMTQPQIMAGMPSFTTEQAISNRRASISSIDQPPYASSEIYSYPVGYEVTSQTVTTEGFAATRRESIKMQQPPAEVGSIQAERDVPFNVEEPYRQTSIPFTEQQPQISTYLSEYEIPLEIITTEAYTRRTSIPSIPQGVSVAPVTITKIQQESIESQEIRGPEKVVSSRSHMYSSSISNSGQPLESIPSRVTQVVTTEVQRTTVSVVHERLPQDSPSSAVTIQPDTAKVKPLSTQDKNLIYPGDIIDLRTMKTGIKMTDQGMDLTPPESSRFLFSSDSGSRQSTAVQPNIVNLSADMTPVTTLSVVTDSITIVTCTATVSSYNSTPAEKPLDLQGTVTSVPLPLTTYKPFEPLAQIVYRPVNSQPVVSVTTSTVQDIPINLSYEAFVSPERRQPTLSTALGNGGPVTSLEAVGAIDLSNYKPMRAMVAMSDTSPGVVTTVVEDDGTPVDLTAGRRSVCCDVLYKLPFTGSCRTQPPVTTQPDNHLDHRDDHYQFDRIGPYGLKSTDLKSSASETNLTEAGLYLYSPRNDYEYIRGNPDAAIDLTAAKLSAGELLDYTSKATGLYPAKTTAPYPHGPAAGFGVNNVLRTSDGIVYSSVASLVPSTYAITTQPGSIFSTTLTPTSTVHNQSVPVSHGFISTYDAGQIIPFDTGLPKELLPTALADIITGYPEMYSDTTLEAIAASLDALVSSPIFPGLDNTKMAQYQMEREFLQLEKLKQLCLAEELEWERQEIQRYREQEQLMVQQELEELQALKQQLLLQQEEEHQAHMVAQQETYAQQKEQLQQIQQLQLQLQRQLDEHYGNTCPTGNLLEAKYAGVGDSGQYWPVKDESATPPVGHYQEEGQNQHNINVNKLQADQDSGKKIIDSGVQTDDEDSTEKPQVGRKKKTKRDTDSSAQTDDEDQDEWDAPTKSRRRSRKHSSEGRHSSKVSSIAIQTVAEISVQTDHSGTIKRPNVQMDTKVEIIKHISAPENSQRGGSLSCQTELDGRPTPIEVGYSTHLSTDSALRSKVFYNPVSPLSPEKSHSGQRMLTADPSRFSAGPRIIKLGQKSLSDPKSLSPSTEDRMSGYYADNYSGRGSPSGTGKKVKRTLPDPPPDNDSLTGRTGYSTNSARRRLARSTTMARAKILQDIDKELDLVERESSKLRKKQAELDEEEKEIDAKLRYLEMGINRRKEVLLKEREKRERDYLQGVAEERDYMSDSEVGNIREARNDGLERPHTAPQSEFDQFIPPQTEADSQYNTLTSPYSHYAQYVPQTQTTSHYTQQNLYNQQSLYHQQVSPYTTLSLPHGQTQPTSYQHALLLQQGKQRQTTMSDLEPKITTNYEVIRNQPLLIVPTSSESGYGVTHLGGKYGNLDLRLGLEERSMASSPMSSVSADSFYADIDHHNARNYVLIEDIGELTKSSTGLSNTGLGSGFTLPDKELSKADRLLRAAEVRRTAEVADFLGSSRLQGYGKGEDDTMEEPYELKLLKQQIKQEFRRGTEGLENLSGIGLPQYLHSDSSFRHFPKGEKYSIGRLTLEKQAAKQLPAAMLYQKQMKNKKAFIDPKAITKFSPIQESRDIEPEFANYMGSGASSVSSLAARARILQDEITFGLRKNLSEQQKYLGSSLGANLSGSLNIGQSLELASTLRATAQHDGTYPSGSRSRPSSRPSSVYGLDLSIKRDLSSSSLRLKTEGDVLDAAFAPGVARAKPTSLPISQSRGRIPIVAQNSEEESPLSPVGQPMGMARASAGPLPPISADSRDQFGSSHSLPEVQQHMREESRTRGYDRDIAFIMDDLQGAMSDSEAYHLRREDTDWFDKPREGRVQSTSGLDRRQVKLVPYAFPHTRVNLKRDSKDTSVSGNGLGIRVVGGKEIPGSRGEIGAYIAKLIPGGVAEQTGKVLEGMQVLEWNGVPLMGKTYEEVQSLVAQPCAEAEICVRLDLNMLSDPEHPQALEHHIQFKAGGQRSPGVDPKQLAAELHKVSQLQTPGMAGAGLGPGGLGVLSALERSSLLHSGTGSAASSGVPSPGQPASPAINKKQRHKPTESMPTPHPISGEIQLQINYDRNLGNLIVHVLQARNLAPRDNDSYSDPFVKVYLLPGRGQVMVVQNASAENKRRTKYAQRTLNPEWNQTVIYKNIHLEQLKKKTLEVTVWDYDRSSSNDFLGEVLIDLSNTAQLDNTPRWLPLKEQSESIEHSRAHHMTQGPPGSGQGHGQGQGHLSTPGPGYGMGHSQAPGQDDGSHDSPKNSVIKSRSHGIFPDPAKDMQMLPLEKSHSSPGSSKSSSDGQLRSHGPSRSQSKSSVTQAHLEDAGIAIAAAEAAVQQSRLQPRLGHRLGDVSGSVVLSAPSLVGDAYGDLDGDEGVGTGVDSAIFQVPRIGKAIPNGTDKNQLGTSDNEGGKTQVMGEIKVALKKEVKTEGDQLVLEILQCRNITYKFKSPDHLPDLYVKLYVVNVATQRRIIKKKTRVCRHDREPSFNETFRFPLNPTGHSIQLFLVSNGGKFMKKTLIGEAYIWLDKVDMRKRVVSWHKLFVSSTQTIP